MKYKILQYIGYMSEQEAANHGFTWHGSYYGIPLWMTQEDCPVIAPKWAPMEYVMSAFHVFEEVVRTIAFPDLEPAFTFKYIKPITGKVL